MAKNWKDIRKGMLSPEEATKNALLAEELLEQADLYLPLEGNLLVRKEGSNQSSGLYVPDSPRVAERVRVISVGAGVNENLVGHVIILGSPVQVVGSQLDLAGSLFMIMYDVHTVRGVDMTFDPIILDDQEVE